MPESSERGALTEAVYYILLALFHPMHGYGIMQYVTEMSSGRVVLGPGTLYGAISTMLEKKWIEAVSGDKDSRKKEYKITHLGIEITQAETARLRELFENGEKVLGGMER
ncbi:MAG: helix-turn-helix transcriptional regulator [Eubacteriales bacterium]